jgi:hypothetical protein
VLRTSGFASYFGWVGDFIRHYALGIGGDGGSTARTFATLALFLVVMVFAMVGVCVCLFRDENLARDITYMLG